MKTLEITIPVYNEVNSIEEQIGILIRKLSEFQRIDLNVGLVIADNGSNDGTKELAMELTRTFPNVRLLSLDEKGVGRALFASWDSSRADFVGYMDLDLATSLNHLEKVFSILIFDNAKIVNATRLSKQSNVIGRKAIRTLTSKGFNLLLRIIFKTKLTDGMCGFKFLHRSAFDEIKMSLSSTPGWFFATKLLLIAESKNIRVQEIPVTWVDDQESKVVISKLSLEYLREIMQLRREIKQTPNSAFLRF